MVRERAKARTTSRYRGVTHHCRTRRWESHIWENSKQLYLGGFDSEHQAALVRGCRPLFAALRIP